MVNSNSLPPQNIEAEESILGGILLDPEAIGRVVDFMVADAFYVKAHRDIYETVLKLHAQGKPTDLMTVTSSLQDYHLLEKVGGMGKLAQLVDRTVSAVNIDRYAALVMDKYLRRQLISAGHEIIELGYDTTQELDVVFDECEKKIFRLTQKRAQEGLVSISETLIHTFTELEKLHQKTSSPGLETDFYDLDAITGGLQRSDLIILAGRPSMGKTAFGLNIASNIARKHNLPVAIFSLEMSKEQLALRFLASEAEIDSNRLRTGHFSQNELEPLSMALGSLSSLPIFIDDASNISVMQMRSQVRRLQSEQKGQIGLVLIDYLQLMEGATDNRVQELSKMTRSLKGLAREINAPVIALSQLSRGVESRTNKRPMMSDLRESGCLSGDSLITLADSGKQIPIRELVGQSNFFVWGLNEETIKLEKALVSNAFSTGIKPVYLLKTRLGRTIKATANHKFSTIEGWKRLDELDIGEHIALPQSEKITNLAHSDIYWDSIISITESGTEEVFDLTVPTLHNFVANDIIVHNSIEQDADLIMMIYRDEYYNPDSPDRGIAELLITKHRNGPTGVIKLLFKPEFTQFLNLQKYENY
jgi:replicative DNA helicase